ncbi:MAG: CAP domain-containing protein [Chloroflexota bacterium]
MRRAFAFLAVLLTFAFTSICSAPDYQPATVLAAEASAPTASVRSAMATLPQLVPTVAPAAASPEEVWAAAMEDEIIRLTNIERAKQGLLPVRKNAALTRAALAHNEDMITNNFVSHTGSNGSHSPQRALAAGYAPYGWGQTYVGENIAAGLHTPEAAMQGWLNSPAHKANLLRPEYRELGVGVSKGGRYGTYWTQNFGSAPNVFPAFVNGGATVVTSEKVELTTTDETISAWGSMGRAVQMMIANDEAFTGAKWQPYVATTSWELPAGAGPKTVYVRLRDASGDVGTTSVQVELQPATVADSGASS